MGRVHGRKGECLRDLEHVDALDLVPLQNHPRRGHGVRVAHLHPAASVTLPLLPLGCSHVLPTAWSRLATSTKLRKKKEKEREKKETGVWSGTILASAHSEPAGMVPIVMRFKTSCR